MPTSKPQAAAEQEAVGVNPVPEPVPPSDAPQPEQSGPEPGVYEYAYFADCVYPSVPLTAYAADPGRPATDDEPATPPVTATVFDWPFGPPDDGRWAKTRKKPNQRADNEPPLNSEE